MAIKDLIDKIRNFGLVEKEDEDIPREIRDKHLESLRRERQVQMNEVEKHDLKKAIAEYKMRKMRENLYGIKDNRELEKQYLGEHQHQRVNVMSDEINVLRGKSILRQKKLLQKRSILNNRINEFKRRKKQRYY